MNSVFILSTQLESQARLHDRKLFSFVSLFVLLAALQATSWAQPSSAQNALPDPPGRVARLNLAEGAVSFAPAEATGYSDGNAWTPAKQNRPLTRGDRLWTGQRARSELHIGSSALRMNEETSLGFLALDDSITQLRLAQGTLQLRVRALFEDQRLEIDTPNLAFVISRPGNYRLDVNPASDTTRIVAQSGSGMIYGDNGVSLPLGNQQQATFSGTRLAPAAPGAAIADSFDLWAADRDRREDQSVSARYVPRETIGYQQLDSYGDWQQDPAYGAVWLPRAVPVNWAPYRAGRWDWISPWGWTWVDDAPWGFAPFHYGRWAQIGPRWAWVPGQLPPRPVYAPALVAFVGGSHWNLAVGTDSAPRPALGWFPLAPGEVFRPAYRVSPRYVSLVNNTTNINISNTVNVTNIYRYQHQPAAVTTASREDFAHSRRMPGSAHALSAADLSRAQVLATQSALPQRQEQTELRERPHPSPAALPPAGLAAQSVVRSQGERGNDRQPLLSSPNRENEPPNGPRPSRFERSPPSPPRLLAAPIATAPAVPLVQPPAVRLLPAPALDHSTSAVDKRVKREQLHQQSETPRQPDQQRVQGEAVLGQQRALREQGQRPQELVRQQAQQLQHDQQRRQAQGTLDPQRMLREQAQHPQAQAQQQPQRRQNELQRDQQPGNGGMPIAATEARAANERNAAEQAQRAQQQLQRQQAELNRQQDQMHRQDEDAMRQQQRAMHEQAQQQRASQQLQRQAQALQKPLPDQRRPSAQAHQPTRPAETGHLRPARPEGDFPRKQEP
ncbi:hypothetical protein RCH06_001398 [Polaromonas sp. CG_9.5]|uniref:DUF6600 domain-containing protein n=1 Tax=Polaromonas sp. CG_9.5 TaxID=3071705 RepID=UPI002DFE11B0|nr:hypothetical protein [Polaromonas sp. CG_9.5]